MAKKEDDKNVATAGENGVENNNPTSTEEVNSQNNPTVVGSEHIMENAENKVAVPSDVHNPITVVDTDAQETTAPDVPQPGDKGYVVPTQPRPFTTNTIGNLPGTDDDSQPHPAKTTDDIVLGKKDGQLVVPKAAYDQLLTTFEKVLSRHNIDWGQQQVLRKEAGL